jgi:hypothetical protein
MDIFPFHPAAIRHAQALHETIDAGTMTLGVKGVAN